MDDKLTAALDGQQWSKLKATEKFETAWKAWGYDATDMTTEHEFDSDRDWRFDYAWPSLRVAVEINGFGYGHQRKAAVIRDAEKTRTATAQGWCVLVFTSACVVSQEKCYDAVEQVCLLLSRRHGLVDWNDEEARA